MITSPATLFSLPARFETGLYCYRFNASKQIIMAPVKTQTETTLFSVLASSAATKLLNLPVTQTCIAILLNSRSVSKHGSTVVAVV